MKDRRILGEKRPRGGKERGFRKKKNGERPNKEHVEGYRRGWVRQGPSVLAENYFQKITENILTKIASRFVFVMIFAVQLHRKRVCQTWFSVFYFYSLKPHLWEEIASAFLPLN